MSNAPDSSIQIPDEVLANSFGCSIETASKHSPFIRGAMKAFDITTANRIAMFIAQTGHETAGLKFFQENLNYSKDGLLKTWPKRFTEETATLYQRKPEMIANLVYANRMGNKDEKSGDGWKYKGTGAIQLTGYDNYKALSGYFNIDFIANPNLLLEPVNSWLAAGWFWNKNKLNQPADKQDVETCTRIINGGQHGLEDRRARFLKALALLEGIIKA
jgi:putative chitinase